MESKELKFLVFTLEGHKLALHLSRVERVIPAVEITPLSNMPPVFVGVINMRGAVLPVADVRPRLRMTQKEVLLTDKLIVADTGSRKICILADEALGVFEYGAGDIIPSAEIMEGIVHAEGAIRLKDGVILIQDLGRFLTPEEETMLDSAVKKV